MLGKVWLPSILLCAAATAVGQFTELAATDDGQDLYFSTPLRIEPASAMFPESRVFHVGLNGIELFAERGALTPVSPGFISSGGIGQAQVTGNGSLIGVTAHNICPGGGPCNTPSATEGLLRGSQSADLGPGALQLSKNGRWVVLTQTVLPNPPPTSGPIVPTITATLIDLQTNQTTAIPPPVANYGMLASNGAVLVNQSNPSGGLSLGIWRQGQFTPLTLGGAIRPVAMSDDGGTLVFTRINPTPGVSLMARNLATGDETTLYASPAPGVFPTLLGTTNDGSHVLYNVWNGQAAGPAFVANAADGSSIPLLLNSGELATAGTLSGSGNAAYLATTAGRIVKFALSAGGASPPVAVVPESYYVTHTPGPFAPGSSAHLNGALPREADLLAGNIIVDGRIVPILYAGSNDIRAQIPWETKTGLVSLLLNFPNGSPFSQNDLVFVFPYAPDIARADPGEQTLLGLKLVKGDFSGLVTTPPQPGDLIIGYFTGLGPVTGSIQTGMPAPADDLRPIIGQLTCQFQPGQSPMKTLYAGLAPLMIGLYQVILQAPPDAGQVPITGLQCTASGPGGQGSFIIVGSPPQPAQPTLVSSVTQSRGDRVEPTEADSQSSEVSVGGEITRRARILQQSK